MESDRSGMGETRNAVQRAALDFRLWWLAGQSRRAIVVRPISGKVFETSSPASSELKTCFRCSNPALDKCYSRVQLAGSDVTHMQAEDAENRNRSSRDAQAIPNDSDK